MSLESSNDKAAALAQYNQIEETATEFMSTALYAEISNRRKFHYHATMNGAMNVIMTGGAGLIAAKLLVDGELPAALIATGISGVSVVAHYLNSQVIREQAESRTRFNSDVFFNVQKARNGYLADTVRRLLQD